MVIERANTMRGSRNFCCPFSSPVGENYGDGGRIMIEKVGDVYILIGRRLPSGGACCSKKLRWYKMEAGLRETRRRERGSANTF